MQLNPSPTSANHVLTRQPKAADGARQNARSPEVRRLPRGGGGTERERPRCGLYQTHPLSRPNLLGLGQGPNQLGLGPDGFSNDPISWALDRSMTWAARKLQLQLPGGADWPSWISGVGK